MTTTTYPRGHDPRRSFMVHGETYRRNMHRRPEPPISLWQATASGLALAVFVVGGLCVMAGVL